MASFKHICQGLCRQFFHCVIRLLVATTLLTQSFNHAVAAKSGEWIDLAIETNEVTWPDVAIMPDGGQLIFTLLGHLVQIPVSGGKAKQLTFGGSYDARPSVSPDGKHVAFQSDRDGSEGNIFLLELENGDVQQATKEPWADVPVWSPDGRELVYVSFDRNSWQPWSPILIGPPVGVVKKLNLDSGETTALTEAPADVRSPFYLNDGRLGWVVVDRVPFTTNATSRIQVMGPDGQSTTLKTVEGFVDSVTPAPDGSGLYALRYFRADFLYNYRKEQNIVLLPFDDGPVQVIMPISGEGMLSHHEPKFAVAPDGQALYAGNFGRLFQVKPPAGLRAPVPFRADISRAVRRRMEPPPWKPIEPGTVARPRSLEDPQISADGSQLTFRSAGRVWLQTLPDGEATKVADELTFGPAFSPDASQLAYIAGKPAEERDYLATADHQINIYNTTTGQTRTLVSEKGCPFEHLNWVNPDVLVAGGCDKQAVIINASSGAIKDLVDTQGPEASPQLTTDANTLYYIDQGIPPIFDRGHARKVRVEGESEPEILFPVLTSMKLRISPDGKWAALPSSNGPGVVVAALTGNSNSAVDFQVLDRDAFTEFNFTPDSKALIYAANGRIWRKPLSGGERQEIPVRLKIEAPTPGPILLKNARVLDFKDKRFSKEVSLLIDKGRIKKVGRIGKGSLPKGTQVIDATGKFAIPGLIEGHGHGGGCGVEEYLAYGITSVRNMGGSLVAGNAQADQGDLMGDPASRCFTSGPIFEGEHGRVGVGFFVHPQNEQEARAWVRQWKENGAAFVKLYWMMPSSLQRAAVDEAHRIGMPVYAHGITLDETVKAMIHGYSGLTHLQRHLHDDLLSLVQKTGTIWDTTLGVMGFEWMQRSEPERVVCHTGGMFFRGVPDDALRGRWLDILASVKEAHGRGIPLLPGTDHFPSGNAYHLELEFYQDAGIAPVDVLKSATLDVAVSLGAGNELGSIDVGKLADIVLLDANPLLAISNARSVWRVIKGGKVFEPEKLGFNPSSLYRPDYCEAAGGLSTQGESHQ